MNYYSHNIGDYAQATMHLSLIEDAVYNRLLRRYYAEETPLIDDMAQLCRWVGARSEEEKAAVEVVISEFFVLRDGYWHNNRADREIDAYQAKSMKASESAAKRWHSKESPKEEVQKCERNANAMQTHTEGNANQETITNNQETIKDIPPNPQGGTAPEKSGTGRSAKQLDFSSWPEDPDPKVWDEYRKHRAKLKVGISQMVVTRLGKELHKAASMGYSVNDFLTECIFRGWKGGEASWLTDKNIPAPTARSPKQEKFDPTAYVNRNRVQSHDIIDI